MNIICDLHLHSRYSLATSRSLNLNTLANAGRTVGLDLLAAPDFTHPIWRDELRTELAETAPGSGIFSGHGRNFMLMSEVSCIWRQLGKSRRVHILVSAPSFAAVDKMCDTFATLQNLESDGRPIFKISARELLQITRDADPRCEIVPAHVFTPWYGIFGAKSGFDSLEECFEDMADEIFAIETGLSSDPAMHWSVPDSRKRAIISFSDAHSVGSLGREATVLDVDELSYESVVSAVRKRQVIETYEFYPEHGKYHYDGHRKCGIRMHPDESEIANGICTVCKRPMTLGVFSRARDLSDRKPVQTIKSHEGSWQDGDGRFAPYRHLVPLRDILASVFGVGKQTKRVQRMYTEITHAFGSEFDALLNADENDLAKVSHSPDIARAIIDVRHGNVIVEPGYDGVYGTATPISAVHPNNPTQMPLG